MEYFAASLNPVTFRVLRRVTDPEVYTIEAERTRTPSQVGSNSFNWDVDLQPGDCFGHVTTNGVLTYNDGGRRLRRNTDSPGDYSVGDEITFDQETTLDARTYAYKFVFMPSFYDSIVTQTQGQVSLPSTSLCCK